MIDTQIDDNDGKMYIDDDDNDNGVKYTKQRKRVLSSCPSIRRKMNMSGSGTNSHVVKVFRMETRYFLQQNNHQKGKLTSMSVCVSR